MNSWEAEQLERLKKDYEKQERELKEKLAKKKAKLDAATRRLRARAAATERKQDTRRKILAGPGCSPAPTRTRRPRGSSRRGSMDSSNATGTGHCSTLNPGPQTPDKPSGRV